MAPAPERMRQLLCRSDPRWEPYAGKPHVRICAGGATALLPAFTHSRFLLRRRLTLTRRNHVVV